MVFVFEFKLICLYVIYIKVIFKVIDFVFVNCLYYVVMVFIVYKVVDLILIFIVWGMFKGFY